MKEIVVCGEGLVDLVPAGAGPLSPLVPALGGGPFNVAITLGRLGSAVSLISRLSDDPYGDALTHALRAAGVNLSLLQRGSEATTLALTNIGEDGSAQYSFYLDNTADRLVADPGELPRTVGALAFGTLSMVLEPGASVYEALLHRSHAEGRLTMLDPNIRAGVIDDPDAYRTRFGTWLPSLDIVKVSDDDAEWLAPGGGGPEQWIEAGVGAVLTTRGADGLSVLTEGFSVEVPAPTATVVDTIGAGDTICGALLHWLDTHRLLEPEAVRQMSQNDWSEALGFAATAAAVTVSRPGADPPWAGEL
ncbi:carbohydrate kinase family protein [Gordonia rubripertincta]|uniref:Carbohydrate kinase n=1 Tax=Gordonia rubripertincta TaxID=36822 RepID=A0ABT4N2N0_GORRU|nr:carbohydrate kinase [Gordonia rubripertincta]MCZ4553528.1 carbohydrate kinase [Gordonia rubripertincta]